MVDALESITGGQYWGSAIPETVRVVASAYESEDEQMGPVGISELTVIVQYTRTTGI